MGAPQEAQRELPRRSHKYAFGSPAGVTCTGFQGFRRRPWTKGPRQEQFMFVKQSTDKISSVTFLRVSQNTPPTTRAEKSTPPAPLIWGNKKKKKKEILTLFPLPDKCFNRCGHSLLSCFPFWSHNICVSIEAEFSVSPMSCRPTLVPSSLMTENKRKKKTMEERTHTTYT